MKDRGVNGAQGAAMGSMENMILDLLSSGAMGLHGLKLLLRGYAGSHDTSDPQTRKRLREAMYKLAAHQAQTVAKLAELNVDRTKELVRLLQELDPQLDRSPQEALLVIGTGDLNLGVGELTGTFTYRVAPYTKPTLEPPAFATFYRPDERGDEVALPLTFGEPRLTGEAGKERTFEIEVSVKAAQVKKLTTARRYRAIVEVPRTDGGPVVLTIELLTGHTG
jgi:hypothetical protein